MAEKTYLQAISDGLRQEMRRDKRVFVLGEDVGVYGGAFKVTLGFQEEFGSWRVIDTPLSETAIMGGATGAAIMGLRPGRRDAVRRLRVVRVGPPRHRRGEAALARGHARAARAAAAVGRRLLGGPFHSQNPESSFAHIPGLKCVCPRRRRTRRAC
jgi:2-oxoisovalerate dehydrogenase E1 component beta subunit